MTPSETRLPCEARRVLISVNPKAGRRSGQALAHSLSEMLGEQGLLPLAAECIEDLEEKAHRWMETGELRAVVAAGGDGTVALVANHTPPGTPIAVLPLGTENLLSKYLHISADSAAVCRTIVDGNVQRMDAGLANGRVFLLMVGCGFDADVVRRLHEARQGNIHHLSYAKPILDSIRNYDYPELRISCDTTEAELDPTAPPSVVTARWAFVVNLPRYAFGLGIAPAADGGDGLLDVCTFKEGSLWNGLRYLSAVWMGRAENWEECVRMRTPRLRIESDRPAPYQLDGDPGGFLPVDVRVLPGRLTLLVPQPALHQSCATGPS